MPEWHPIETVPKDGTWFIACRAGEDDSYEIGCYDPYHSFNYVEVSEDLFRREKCIAYEWRGINNMHLMTHWAPALAVPPATEST